MAVVYPFLFDENQKSQRQCACAIVITGLVIGSVLLFIILLATCVNIKVGQSEVGIFINSYNSEIRGPYAQGTYTKVPGEDLYTYERIYQTRSYSGVSCLTKDILSVSVDVAMQFQYNVNSIVPQMLRQFNSESEYMELFDNAFWKSYLSSCAKYTAEEFYNIRSQVESSIYQEMKLVLDSSQQIGIDIQSLQLVHTTFPTQFSDIISLKQSTVQNITTNLNAREGLLTQAETEILQAQQQATINLINANNTATVAITTADVNYDVILKKWQLLGTAFADVISSMNYNTTAFINYLQYSVIQQATSPIINLSSV